MAELQTTYASLRLQVVDACMVALAEPFDVREVAALVRRDFLVVALRHLPRGERLTLLPGEQPFRVRTTRSPCSVRAVPEPQVLTPTGRGAPMLHTVGWCATPSESDRARRGRAPARSEVPRRARRDARAENRAGRNAQILEPARQPDADHSATAAVHAIGQGRNHSPHRRREPDSALMVGRQRAGLGGERRPG